VKRRPIRHYTRQQLMQNVPDIAIVATDSSHNGQTQDFAVTVISKGIKYENADAKRSGQK
jgi:hypothetical protein